MNEQRIVEVEGEMFTLSPSSHLLQERAANVKIDPETKLPVEKMGGVVREPGPWRYSLDGKPITEAQYWALLPYFTSGSGVG